MNTSPYYYGQGRLYLSKIKFDGTPENLLWLGDCSGLTLNIASEITVKKTSRGGRRLDAGLSVTDTTASLSFTLYEHSQENIARALWGRTESSIAAFVAGQPLPDGMKPGQRFIICHASVWDVYIPGLEDGTDYKVDYLFGAIEFITAPPDGLTVSYYHSRHAHVTLLSTLPDDLYLRYEGNNLASPEQLVMLDIYRVKLSPVDVFSLINNDSSVSSISINARVLPDLSRYTGADFDLFGRMGTSRRFDGAISLNIQDEPVGGVVSMDGAISVNYSAPLENRTVKITATTNTNRIYTTTVQTDSAGRYVASIVLPFGIYSVVAECELTTPYNNLLTLVSDAQNVEVPGPVVEFVMRIDSLTRPLFYARRDEEITIDYGDGVESTDFRFENNTDVMTWCYTTRELIVGQEYHIKVKGSSTLRFASAANGGATSTNSLMELIKVTGDRTSMSAFASNKTTLHTIHPGALKLPLATGFSYAFSGCSALVSLPDDLLQQCPLIDSASGMFRNCTGLITVPEGLFAGREFLTDVQNVFYNCSSLVSVGSGLFRGCILATNFSYAFYLCKSLSEIGSDFLAGCDVAFDFSFCFYGCSSLVQLPADLFSEAVSASSFASCFQVCTSLKNIPANLFKNCLLASSFLSTFSGCTQLLEVPDSLFMGLSNITTFQNTFSGCLLLEKVGRGVFKGCNKATTFANTFYNCRALISVGNDIFSGCESVTTFASTFYFCQALVSMPDFSSCSKVTNFSNAFRECLSLVEIPDNAFANKTLATSFYYAFMNCVSLVRVGSGAFKGCSSLTNLSYTFQGASSLSILQGDIFEGCEKVSNVTFLFYQCISLQSIPEHIFDSFISVTNMQGVFRECTGLISIPESLFDYCIALTTLNATFADCSSLSAIPAGLLKNTVLLTSLPSAFSGCSSIPAIPEILFINTVLVVSLTSTFAGCSSVTVIPANLLSFMPLLTDVSGIFNGLAIEAIPDELFYKNVMITSFGNSFRNCQNLLAVSAAVFSKNINATMFNYVFTGCTSLKAVGNGIFDNCAAQGIAYMLSGCVSFTGNLAAVFPLSQYPEITNTTHAFSDSGIQGSGLAFIAKLPNVINHYYTFNNCAQLIDFDNIPGNWTGNKL